MIRRLALLLCLFAIGCQQAEERPYLELVPNTEREQPPEPISETLLITWRAAEGPGPLSVTLPLPVDDDVVTIRSLAVEVDPPGEFELEGDAAHVLHLSAREGSPAIRTRLLIERLRRLEPELPAPLQAISRDLTPREWVARAASEAPGSTPRLAFGLAYADASATLHAWPEVRVENRWQAVSLASAPEGERLRLGLREPIATRTGEATPLRVEVERLP